MWKYPKGIFYLDQNVCFFLKPSKWNISLLFKSNQIKSQCFTFLNKKGVILFCAQHRSAGVSKEVWFTFPAFFMGVLQLPWVPWLSPNMTPPDISRKVNDSAELSEIMLEFRSIFVSQKVLLITTCFHLGLKKKILEFPKGQKLWFFAQLNGLSGYCSVTHLCEKGREITPNRSALVWSLLQFKFNCT